MSAAQLTNDLLAARADPAAVRELLSAHMQATDPPTYTRDVSVALCGVLRVLHKLCHELPELDPLLETTIVVQEDQ